MAELKNTAKLERLEQKIGAERADLAQTIEHLQRLASGTAGRIRKSVSVEALKSDAGQYAGKAVSGALAAARDKVLANPLQAVAVGAGLAYPLLRILRQIPPPLLMMGAGLALASRSGAGPAERHKAVRDEGSEGHSQQHSPDAQHAVRSQVTTGTHDLADAGRRMLHDGMDAGARLVEGVSEWTTSATMVIADTAYRTADSIGQTSRGGGNDMLRGVKDHPFVAATIAALVGGAVAAAVPSTTIEDELYGGVGDAVKAKARTSALHGIEMAEAATSRVVENTIAAAKEQGLTPEAVKSAMHLVGQKAQAVVHGSAEELTSTLNSSSSEKPGL